jgi:hypothetical protein
MSTVLNVHGVGREMQREGSRKNMPAGQLTRKSKCVQQWEAPIDASNERYMWLKESTM